MGRCEDLGVVGGGRGDGGGVCGSGGMGGEVGVEFRDQSSL